MRLLRQYRSWFSTQSKLRRSMSKAVPLFVAEPLEARWLLSGVSFAAPVSYPTGTEPQSLAAADFNGDGKPDLAIAVAGAVDILMNNGNGTFARPVSYPDGISAFCSMTVGDFNGDGKPDIAVAGCTDYVKFESGNASVSVLMNNGNGTLAPAAIYTLCLGENNITNGFHQAIAESITSADFNGNGRSDLAVIIESPITQYYTDYVAVLMANSDGTFAPQVQYQSAADVTYTQITTGDFNRDGVPDIVYNCLGDITTLLNNGDGTFGSGQTVAYWSDYNGSWYLTTADLDGDGSPDLIATTTGGILVALNNGAGAFPQTTDYPLTSSPNSLTTADFNGDGSQDLAVAGNNTISMLLNNGNGTFTLQQNSFAAGGDDAVVAADFTGDGKMDLAVLNSGADAVNVLLNNTQHASFSNLSVSSSIAQGTGSVALGGTIAAGASIPPNTETVAITLNGVTQDATINSNGNFSTTFNTSTLPASNTPYQVTYSYAGDASFNSVTDNTTTTLLVMPTNGTETPVYRLYSQVTKEHLYTADLNEYNTLGTRGWDQEGLAYDDYTGLITIGGVTTEPLYRLYNIPTQQHLWTTDPNEYNTLKNFVGTWSVDGISGYIFPANGNTSTSLAAVPGSAALYRMSWPFNPSADLHLWTTDLNEYNTDAATYGWTKEGVIGYVM